MAYDINESLRRLETNLQNLDAARKQVESVIASSDQLQGIAKGYMDSVHALYDEIKRWKEELGKLQTSKASEIQAGISGFKRSCDSIETEFRKSVSTTEQNLQHQLDATGQSYDALNQTLRTRLDELKPVNNVIEKISTEVAGIASSLHSFSSTSDSNFSENKHQLENIQSSENSLTDTVNSISEVITQIQTACSRLQSTLKASSENLTKSIESASLASIKEAKVNRWIMIGGFIVLIALAFILH